MDINEVHDSVCLSSPDFRISFHRYSLLPSIHFRKFPRVSPKFYVLIAVQPKFVDFLAQWYMLIASVLEIMGD